MARLVLWTLWLFITASLSLLGLEVMGRLCAFPQIARPHLWRIVQTPEYRFTIRTNLLGLRGKADIARQKPAREKRLFLVGDSFVFGTGLSEKQTLSTQLNRLLGATSWRVINAGASGTGPMQYEHCIRQVAIPLKADLVAVFFYIGNDLENTWDPYSVFPYSIKNWAKMLLPNAYLWACGWKYNRHLSAENAARIVGYDAWDQMELYRRGRKEGISGSEMRRRYNRLPSNTREKALKGQCNTSILYSALTHPQIMNDTSTLRSSGMQMAMRRCTSIFQSIQRDCEKAKIPLLLVVIPAGYQINDEQWMLWRKMGFDVHSSLVCLDQPQQKISAFCNEQGIPCLDLLPALKRAPIRPLHFPMDGHWRAPTVRWVAATLRDFLQAKKLI